MPRRAPCLAALLAAAACIALHADSTAPGSHAAAFSDDGLIKLDNLSAPPDTHLILDPTGPLAPTDTVIWCATFQLAWNEAIQLVGEKLRFLNEPALIPYLNQENFTRHDLSPASYVALADFYRNNVTQKISDALQDTFHGAQWQELIPTPNPHPYPSDFVAYAYLFKNLAFAWPFQDNDPIIFAGKPVKNFGYLRDADKLPADVLQQVAIYDYQSPDNFVLTLKTKAAGDQLILAKIPPAATLDATIAGVLQRIAGHTPEPSRTSDQLAVPKLNFRFDKSFIKLQGLVLDPSPAAKIHSQLTIARAQQIVRFQLNEKGAVLKSEAIMEMRTLAIARPLDAHVMIFDKPFLILMKQTDSPHPYFAIWVGNPSLLLPAK